MREKEEPTGTPEGEHTEGGDPARQPNTWWDRHPTTTDIIAMACVLAAFAGGHFATLWWLRGHAVGR